MNGIVGDINASYNCGPVWSRMWWENGATKTE